MPATADPTHLQAYFPKWLFGEWDVKAKLKAAQTPLGHEALPKSLEQVGLAVAVCAAGSAACLRQCHCEAVLHFVTCSHCGWLCTLHGPCTIQIKHHDLLASQLHRKLCACLTALIAAPHCSTFWVCFRSYVPELLAGILADHHASATDLGAVCGSVATGSGATAWRPFWGHPAVQAAMVFHPA